MDMEEKDGAVPPCRGEGGCPVPAVSPGEERILQMRSTLIRLKGLACAGAILGAYGAAREDLEFLAFIESELREMKKEDKQQNG